MGLVSRTPGPNSPGVLRMLFLSAVPSTPSSSGPGACCRGNMPVKAVVWVRPPWGAGMGGCTPSTPATSLTLGQVSPRPLGAHPASCLPSTGPGPLYLVWAAQATVTMRKVIR